MKIYFSILVLVLVGAIYSLWGTVDEYFTPEEFIVAEGTYVQIVDGSTPLRILSPGDVYLETDSVITYQHSGVVSLSGFNFRFNDAVVGRGKVELKE